MPPKLLEQGMECKSEVGVSDTDLEVISKFDSLTLFAFQCISWAKHQARHYTAQFHAGVLKTAGGGNYYSHFTPEETGLQRRTRLHFFMEVLPLLGGEVHM